jgi:hypothetical protein
MASVATVVLLVAPWVLVLLPVTLATHVLVASVALIALAMVLLVVSTTAASMMALTALIVSWIVSLSLHFLYNNFSF